MIINVNYVMQKSEAEIELIDNERDTFASKTVKAVLHIFDATDLMVYGIVRGKNIIVPFQFTPILLMRDGQRQYKPKTVIFVYEHSTTLTKNRIVSLGERQTGDEILFEDAKTAETVANQASSTDFSFENANKSITSVQFTISVCRFEYFFGAGTQRISMGQRSTEEKRENFLSLSLSFEFRWCRALILQMFS